MHALREHYATHGVECAFDGIGGEAMTAEGLRSIVPIAETSVVGFWEVAKRYRFFTRLLAQCSSLLASRADDGQNLYAAFIPVDYPGFNLRLAASARAAGVPTYWYIAPQLWAWGAERAARLRAVVNELLVVFPFEKAFFRERGISTHFVGHPLMDASIFSEPPLALADRSTTSFETTNAEPSTNTNTNTNNVRISTIAILPGSRKQEVERNLPIFLEAASELVRRRLREQQSRSSPAAQRATDPAEQYRFCIAIPRSLSHDAALYAIVERYRNELDIAFTSDARSLMKSARAGIVKTGTSTLEAALLGMPFVMAYRTSALTYWIAKRKVTLPHIALANIVAGRSVVPELIQHEATPAKVANALYALLADESSDESSDNFPDDFSDAHSAAQQTKHFAAIRATLGAAGASAHAARLIAGWTGVQHASRDEPISDS
jgi:lipid-A-disaccharide synthase